MSLAIAICVWLAGVCRLAKRFRHRRPPLHASAGTGRAFDQAQARGADGQAGITLRPNVEAKIRSESLQAYQNELETCGFLLGKVTNEETYIEDATGPGAEPSQTGARCEPDYSVLAQHLAKGQRVVGEWHLHLGYGSALSPGDRDTLVNASTIIPGFIAIVVNIKSYDALDMAAFSVRDGEIVKIKLETEQRFARSVELVNPAIVLAKTVTILGLGSGGSKCAELLCRIGVQRFILVDLSSEKLEKVNLPRHIGFERHLGKRKTRVTAHILKLIHNRVKVKTEHFDIIKEEEKLVQAVSASDLVIACPGDPAANACINKVCLELTKPAVFAGLFERGDGGYVFGLDPSNKEAACFSCLFAMTGVPDSNTVIRQTAQNYGIEESQLHAQQGLCLDTGQIAILQTRLALCLLLKGTEHSVANIEGNLIWVDNRNLQIRVLPVKKREDCYVCNRESWLASVAAESVQTPVEPVLKDSLRNTAEKRQGGFLSAISKALGSLKAAKAKLHRTRHHP